MLFAPLDKTHSVFRMIDTIYYTHVEGDDRCFKTSKQTKKKRWPSEQHRSIPYKPLEVISGGAGKLKRVSIAGIARHRVIRARHPGRNPGPVIIACCRMQPLPSPLLSMFAHTRVRVKMQQTSGTRMFERKQATFVTFARMHDGLPAVRISPTDAVCLALFGELDWMLVGVGGGDE